MLNASTPIFGTFQRFCRRKTVANGLMPEEIARQIVRIAPAEPKAQARGRSTGTRLSVHDGPNVALVIGQYREARHGATCEGEAPTNIRERRKDALDNCCDSVRSVGTWIGHLLHHGRLGPHSSRSGSRGSCRPPDPGAKSPTVTPKTTKLRHLQK